ncbi:MAG TPA: hypothetical protein VFB79_12865, partial [Candidatus Angelobacter sp.]|nr:hypothetical protein [Candidatus Angelobacter sp.]
MKKFLSAATLSIICMYALAGFAQAPASRQTGTADSLLKKFFVDFDLRSAGAEVETRLRRAPFDATALFVRMEAAELQEHPEVVLDSALRLCNVATSPKIQEIASNRILQHAANSRVFNAVLRRVKLASALHNNCAFNLKLALIAAATDGDPKVDLDSAANSAGLLTHWQIAGAFGHYDNVDFERQWPPETDQL